MHKEPAIRPVMRKLLLIELFVCFAPVVVLFSFVLMTAPFGVYMFAVTEPLHWRNLGELLWFLSCGIVGCWH